MGWEPPLSPLPASTGEDPLADSPQASVSVSVEWGWGDAACSLGQAPVPMLSPMTVGETGIRPGTRARGRSVP